MEAASKDEIVRGLHKNAGLWTGKIAGRKCTLYIFQPFEDYPKSIVWEARSGRTSIHTGRSRTVWDAIDDIEAIK